MRISMSVGRNLGQVIHSRRYRPHQKERKQHKIQALCGGCSVYFQSVYLRKTRTGHHRLESFGIPYGGRSGSRRRYGASFRGKRACRKRIPYKLLLSCVRILYQKEFPSNGGTYIPQPFADGNDFQVYQGHYARRKSCVHRALHRQKSRDFGRKSQAVRRFRPHIRGASSPL